MRGLQSSLLLWALWCLINTICIKGDRGELRSVSQGTRGDSVRSVPSSLEDFTPGPGTMLQLMQSGLFNEHIVSCTVNSHFTSWKLHKQEFFCSKLKLLWQMCLASLLTGDGMNRAGSSGFQSSPGYCCQEERRHWHRCVMKQDAHIIAEVTLALISALAHLNFLEKWG